MRDPAPRPSSWIGKAGASVFSVDGKIGGECKNLSKRNMANTPQTLLIPGSNLVHGFLESEEPLNIVGLDNLNDYYDSSLNEYRLGVILKKASEAKDYSCGVLYMDPIIPKWYFVSYNTVLL